MATKTNCVVYAPTVHERASPCSVDIYTFWCLDRRSTKCECDVSRRDLPARVHVSIPFLDTLILERDPNANLSPLFHFLRILVFRSCCRRPHRLLYVYYFFVFFVIAIALNRILHRNVSAVLCAVCRIVHEPNRAENESIV